MNYRKLCYILLVFLLVGCSKEEPTASFSVSKSSAEVDEVITFTNQSENATSYSWDFGDGTSSTNDNPTHVYTTDGTFNVELTATGEGGTSSASETITISYPDPVAGFSMDKSSANVDEIITFTNSSVNATSYSWSFGDGTTSTNTNPTHSYTSDGTFTVQLTATGPGGATSSASETVTIIYPDPVADFTMDKSLADPGETITFTNLSQYATDYTWDFGDGTTSTVTSPTHSYTAEGTYTVQLTAVGDGGTNSTSKNITVKITVTGSWLWKFTLNGTLFDGPFILVEHSDGSLTGTFEFSDGSGHQALESTSNITGDAVTIEVDHNPDYALYMSFRGTANAARDYMSGSLYVNDSYASSFTATKTLKKSTTVNESNYIISARDRLLNEIFKK